MNTENQEDRREGTIYQAQREAGRNYRRFATELEARGWRFLPGLPEGKNPGEKFQQPNRLAGLTEALVWLAGIEGENLKQSKDEAIRSKAAEIFRLGMSAGWDKRSAAMNDGASTNGA